MNDIIYGKNAVLEALKSGRRIAHITIGMGNVGGGVKPIMDMAKERGVTVKRSDIKLMDKIAKGGRHQGVIAYASPIEFKTIDDMIELAKTKNEFPLLLLLDGITDPHNLGAIIRSAECLGAHGALLPKHRSAPVNEVVAKTSAGAVNFLPIAEIGNAVQTVEKLKKEGFWIIGADMEGESAQKVDFNAPIALVIGSEGKGIGRLLKEKTDILVKIPMKGKVNSLNASVAAGILIYEVMKRRDQWQQ